jgi:FkbM family methyltransferase
LFRRTRLKLDRARLNYARHTSVVGRLRGAAYAALEQIASKPRPVTIRLQGISAPITIRLGTSDLAVVAQVFVDGEYEADYGVEPEIVVDAGANIGASPIYFAERFPDARVIAIEPDPGNYATLESNVAHWPQITPVHAALWPEDTAVQLADHGLGTWGYRATASPDGDIPGLSVERLLEDFGAERINLLKVDIEGAERDLFRGSARWIDRVDAIVIELHDALTPGCSEEFAQATAAFPIRQTHGEHVIVRRT